LADICSFTGPALNGEGTAADADQVTIAQLTFLNSLSRDRGMSALGSKADIGDYSGDVRFTPQS
jgi:hypothetical protein